MDGKTLYTVSPVTYEVIAVQVLAVATKATTVLERRSHGTAVPVQEYHTVDHTWLFEDSVPPKRLDQIRKTLFRRQSKYTQSRLHFAREDVARLERGMAELMELARRHLT